MLWMTWGQRTGTQNHRLVCEHMTTEPIVNTFQWLLAHRLRFKESVLLPDCVSAAYGRLMTFFLSDPIRCERAVTMLDGNFSCLASPVNGWMVPRYTWQQRSLNSRPVDSAPSFDWLPADKR
nr:unnamed protein product [Spirometra erinaceieuropaei]